MANESFETIEFLMSELENVERAQPVYASIAWSRAMAVGHMLTRLQRLGSEDDPASNYLSKDEVEAQIQQLEERLATHENLLSWAVRGANPDLVPSGEAIVERIESGESTPTEDVRSDEDLAAEFGVTVDEIQSAKAKNAERQMQEATRQAEAAKLAHDEIVTRINNAIHREPDLPEVIDQRVALTLVNNIGAKVSQYADNLLAAAMRQRWPRRQRDLNAQRRILDDIEEKAVGIVERMEREANAARSDQEPMEA